MSSFYVENFGCRATQADGASLERQFLDRGLDRARSANDAEIVVLNTCTVTEQADKDARASIRRLQRANPGCRILVTGCYAQRAPNEIAALSGVTWVVGNSHKHQAADIATASFLPYISHVPQTAQQNPNQPSTKTVGFVPLSHLAQSHLSSNEPTANHPASVLVGDIFAHTELLAAPVFDAANERTRPNLKVQDGCDNRCSFCVIPSVRGQSRSLPLDRVIGEVNTLVAAGYREVVISGINLGRWGRDLPATHWPSSHLRATDLSIDLSVTDLSTIDSSTTDLPLTDLPADSPSPHCARNPNRIESLIRAILDRTALEKLRLSSIEPMDWSDDLIALVASSPRLASHAHVPMQSGSDAVLRRMHRKYRPWHYREKILKIRAALPTAAIGADVMVGFPGETNAEFDETRRMVEDLPFTYLHVFTYSPRPGTPAATHPNQVPAPVAQERNRMLRALASAKKQDFLRSLVGSTVPAITLKSPASNPTGNSAAEAFTEALTDNYSQLQIAGNHLPNLWINVKVLKAEGETLIGRSESHSKLPSA